MRKITYQMSNKLGKYHYYDIYDISTFFPVWRLGHF